MNTKQTIFSKISNTLFLIISIFFISLIWINYYIKNLRNSIIYSIIISMSLCTIFFAFKKIKSTKEKVKKNSALNLEYLRQQLLLGNDESTIKKICKAYNINNFTAINEKHIFDYNNNIDYFFIFDTNKVTEKDNIYIIKNKLSNNIKIFCIEYNTSPIIKNCNIEYISIKEILNELNKNNIKINYNIEILHKTKIGLKEVLNSIFNKNKSKSYFWFGFILIISSLFTPFTNYYIISGTILIILSIYSRFNKKFN